MTTMARSRLKRATRLATAATLAAGVAIVPTQSVSADPICPLGICLPLPGDGGSGSGPDDTTVVIDLSGVGAAVGGIVDTVVGGVVPGGLPVGDLPVGDLPPVAGIPVGAVVGAVVSGNAGAVVDVAVGEVETLVNDVLDGVTDVVDGTLDGVGLGDVVRADVHVPIDLTDGVVVSPTADASVDLGGATAALPVPIPELLDTDVNASLCGVNVVLAADHTQDCTSAGPAPVTVGNPTVGDIKLPIDVCGVQVVVAGSDSVDCSQSGGNQSGGATGLISDALLALGLDVGACGVQVALAGDATADCTGRETGVDVDVCVAGQPCIELDLPEVCGVELGVAGMTGVVCYPGDDPTTPPGDDDPDAPNPPADPGDDDPDGDDDDGDDDGDDGDDDGDDGSGPDDGSTGDGDDAVPGGGGTGGGGQGLLGGELPHTGVAVTSMLLIAAALVGAGTLTRRLRTVGRSAAP